jgi:hypothetical protein
MEWRNPNRSFLSTYRGDNSIHNFKGKSEPVGERAAVGIRAIVDIIMDKGIKQVSICTMDLNAIKARFDCISCGLDELPYNFFDIIRT